MIRLELGTGHNLGRAALAFWAGLDARAKAAMPWDAEKPEAVLRTCLADSGLIAIGYADDQPSALAFTQGHCPTCQVHFTMTRGLDSATRLTFGFAFLKAAFQKYACLLCLIPKPYRGARAYVNLLNFESLAILPGACFIARRGRVVDGELFAHGSH